MKKIFCALAAVTLLAGMVSCKDKEGDGNANQAPTTITTTEEESNIKVGDSNVSGTTGGTMEQVP